MLNYAGEYGEYCDTCQLAVTVIRSSVATWKSCLERLTMSYVIGDSAYQVPYLIFSAVLQTEATLLLISGELCVHGNKGHFMEWAFERLDSFLPACTRHRQCCFVTQHMRCQGIGTELASCIPGVAVLARVV